MEKTKRMAKLWLCIGIALMLVSMIAVCSPAPIPPPICCDLLKGKKAGGSVFMTEPPAFSLSKKSFRQAEAPRDGGGYPLPSVARRKKRGF